MASLHVESLFTNIPLEETIENCVNDLFFNKSAIANLTKQNVCDLLPTAAKEPFFIFNNSLYRQINRVAVDSPLGPILPNPEFKSKIYKRYFDDIFLMFRFRDNVKTLVYYMNTKHSSIRFTFEIEDQNSFSFLGIKIIKILRKKLLKHQFTETIHSVVFLLISGVLFV